MRLLACFFLLAVLVPFSIDAIAQTENSPEAIELTKLKTKPTFKLDLMTVETGGALMPNTLDSGKNPLSIGLGITIPWSSTKNRSQIHEAELKHATAIANKRAMENQTLANLKKIYFRLENARRLVELYENSLIPQAEQAIEVAETWHQEGTKSITGFLETQSVWLNFNLARLRAIAVNTAYQAAEVDFLNFLDAERTLLKFRLDEQRALRDHRQHLVQLEQAVGETLPKQPLNLTKNEGEKKE
ncbi:MAG: TolC family protein [Candidatus Poribacteria bacterium]|nr:TolC family protein [Candidatus Poribacteria bacterium]